MIQTSFSYVFLRARSAYFPMFVLWLFVCQKWPNYDEQNKIKMRGHRPEQKEESQYSQRSRRPSGGQNYPLQQARNTVVRCMAGFTAGLEGTPWHQAGDRQERAEQAEEDRGLSGPITRKLSTSSIGMCPSDSRGGVVVERGRHPRHPDPPGGPTEAREPGGETHHRSLPDDQSGSAQHGIRTPPRGITVGQPPTSLRPPTRQPPKVGPGTGTCRSR